MFVGQYFEELTCRIYGANPHKIQPGRLCPDASWGPKLFEVKAMKYSGQAMMPRCRMSKYSRYCAVHTKLLLYIFWVYRAELGHCEFKHEVFGALDRAPLLRYEVDYYQFHRRVKEISPERWKAYGKRYNGDPEFYRVTPNWLSETFIDEDKRQEILGLKDVRACDTCGSTDGDLTYSLDGAQCTHCFW